VPNSAHKIDVRITFSALFFNYATTRACNGMQCYMVVFSLKGRSLKRSARLTVLKHCSGTAIYHVLFIILSMSYLFCTLVFFCRYSSVVKLCFFLVFVRNKPY